MSRSNESLIPASGFKTRVRRGSCPRTAPLGARAEKRPSRETALRAKRGAPFAVTRDRVLKLLLIAQDYALGLSVDPSAETMAAAMAFVPILRSDPSARSAVRRPACNVSPMAVSTERASASSPRA